MNIKELNRIVSVLDNAFDTFLGGPLWAILCGMALVGYIVGVTS